MMAPVFALLTCGDGPLNEVPTSPRFPDPFELGKVLQARLPPNWRLGQPMSYLGITRVKVNIVDDWRGNPIAAAVNLCPDTDNEIWRQVDVLWLVMRYRQRDWPPYECRP
jgi:hypothetical protein